MCAEKKPTVCDGCGQRDRCREVYERLGRSDAPNMTAPALWGFVAPLAVFVIVSAAAWSALAQDAPSRWRVVAVFAIGALSAWLAAIIISSFIKRQKR